MTMSLIAGVAAFVLTVLAMPHFITYYKIKKISVREKIIRIAELSIIT